MIKGIGIDIVELHRIAHSLEKSERLADRVLTPKEKELFERMPTDQRRSEFLAGRFAAKEAFAKATGTGIGILSFQDIEVTTDKTGAPNIRANGYESLRPFLSITHSREYAVAQVVLESK
ncbi:holo-ACP synthase [Lentibacillus sediminis]|uniref:holo-ACP synthase n=1 Tax=Lentibacillus sediminis TaxID=1940529 RepID=UPI000C1C5533|nr:holo-ACP synthase [Lentibacillus sediminis]